MLPQTLVKPTAILACYRKVMHLVSSKMVRGSNLNIYLFADLLFGSTKFRSQFICDRVDSAPFRLPIDHRYKPQGHDGSVVTCCSIIRPDTSERPHNRNPSPSPHLQRSPSLPQPLHVPEANGPQVTNTSASNVARKRISSVSCVDKQQANRALLSSPLIGVNTSLIELASSMTELGLERPQLQ